MCVCVRGGGGGGGGVKGRVRRGVQVVRADGEVKKGRKRIFTKITMEEKSVL